jgi:hypothetical protein
VRRPSPAVLQRLAFAGKALVMTALLAAAVVLVVRAQRHRRAEPRHLVDLAVWSAGERPAWATTDDVAQIRRASGLSGRALPLYDRDAAEVVRAALEATPRARRVVSMHRVPPNAIDVVFEMRRPVAAVAVPAGGWVEVDAEGVVLGPVQSDRPARDGVPLRTVTGAAAPIPGPGDVCADDVRAGVELGRLLDGYRDGLGERILRVFDEVDVANHGGRRDAASSELLLRAAPPSPSDARSTPCVVEWGRLGTRFGEPAFDAKAARLERAIAIFGEGVEGVARVRVAFETLTVLPLDGAEGAWLPALAEQTLGR